jgi:hypothetical protein
MQAGGNLLPGQFVATLVATCVFQQVGDQAIISNKIHYDILHGLSLPIEFFDYQIRHLCHKSGIPVPIAIVICCHRKSMRPASIPFVIVIWRLFLIFMILHHPFIAPLIPHTSHIYCRE